MMTTITSVRTVGVPVADQDRALGFFADTLGFEVRLDAPISETERWIEVVPAQSATSIALIATGDGGNGVDTGVRFSVPDAQSAHDSMTARGVQVDELLRWEGMPPMYTFADPDGNRFYVVEDQADD
ncbi:MAG TPA: VOC family protein [Jiangellales bacterium]|nr:VOC family protein [Jiangellales bacterium]